MKRKVSIFISILLLILMDQAVKGYVVKEIPLGGMRRFIPKVVSLTYLKNSGAAFSMLENQQWFFTIITLTAMGAAFVYLYRHIKGSLWLLLGLTLIISGGIGNFIDRVRQGFVVDMFHLDFMNFAIFNVADIYLTVGVGLLLIYILREESHGS
ncbi:signal peptidase II [Streptococcus australis]|uniref:Lipoprotein signal peptidase n=1 Tax=Streptococcus australis ATCC 700641 TaxID=888833 RepID=E7SBN0_9STRE|nr:signal peptidase II [Streptococcus australis]EFV99489.1 signal peptidase II [Streptococcus australis ATCC 700641]EGU64275.1 signal peptidase II [Streptococcus australis ATCC 700641]SQH66219.1 signal peptidase II [Streptococcus australis]